MKLDISLRDRVTFLLYAALLGVPAMAVDVRAYITFEPIKVLATSGIGVLLVWWGVMWGVNRNEMSDGDLRQEDGGDVREENDGEMVCYGIRCRVLAVACFYGYWVSLLLATIGSVAPWVSLFGIAPRYQGIVMYLPLFVAAIGVSRLRRDALEKVLGVAMVTATAVSAFGILQGLIPALMQWWETDIFLGRAFSTMGHPNYLADYLVLVTPLFYWKWISSRKWMAWSLTGTVIGVAFLLTLSRGAMLGLIGSGLFFIGIYGYWHKRKKLIVGAIATPLLLVALIVGVNILPFHGVPASEALKHVPLVNRLVMSEENIRSISTRFTLWPSVVRRIFERPLLGYGPDTFGLSFAGAAPKQLLQSENFSTYADRAHNFFLDSMMNIGVVGTGFLALLLWLTMRIVIRSGDPLILALGSALFGHIISQQFEFSLTVHLIFFWVYIGAIWQFRLKGVSINKRVGIGIGYRTLRYATCLGATLLMIGIFAGYSIPTFLADRFAREGEFAKAMAIAPHRSEYVLAEARELIEMKEDRRHILNLLDAVKWFSGDLDYRPYFYEGMMLQASGEYPKSFLSFEEAIKRSPIFPPLYKAYGKALLESGERERALKQFHQYLDLAPIHRNKVFYKLNPQFDEIFELIDQASIAK